MIKPIRSEQTQYIVHDPWGFGEKISCQEGVSHFLSDTGELISYRTEIQIAFDCGCLGKSAGGYCIDCITDGFKGLICNECFGHCQCGRPICQSHSGNIFFENGESLRLCGPCYSVEKERLSLGIFWNFLLTYF